MKVALQPLPLLVGDDQHPRARATQFLEARAKLDVQTRVLDRDPGPGRRRGQELGLVVE